MGNVGSHLARRFSACNLPITQIYSRDQEKVEHYAKELDYPSTSDFSQIDTTADLYILAVRDDSIVKVAEQLKTFVNHEPLVVHISGSTPITSLEGIFKHYGVFYPLQTFSEDRPVDFTTLPLCVDANSEEHIATLKELASQIGEKVYHIDNRQRSILHVAAVFSNNFTNYLYTIAESIVEKENIPFELLRPLILETALKVQAHSPSKVQTGPAIRKDDQTIERHLEYLAEYPDFSELYQEFNKYLYYLK